MGILEEIYGGESKYGVEIGVWSRDVRCLQWGAGGTRDGRDIRWEMKGKVARY